MTIPVLQGMLKYAFKADPANTLGSCSTVGDNCDKSWAEGWAFAAAVLPRLHYCSTSSNDVAKLVADNLDVAITAGQQMKDGFKALKEAVESVYSCMGITCAEVGEFQTSTGVYEGMEACKDPTTAPAADAGADATTEAPAESTEFESAAALLGLAMLFLNA